MSKKQLLPQTLLLCGFLVFAPLSVQAHSCPLGEITPDNTLGAEASKLTPNVQLQGATTDFPDFSQRFQRLAKTLVALRFELKYLIPYCYNSCCV